MPESLTLLVDNGSLEPAATLQLRELAAALAGRIGAPVAPVSLLHSSGIAPAQLGGAPAEILEPALVRRLAEGLKDFIIVPLFFGPSRALTEYLPERVAHLRKPHPGLRVQLAPPLFAAGDDRLARILADHVRAVGVTGPLRVALVDHGSPAREVNAVRDALAAQLQGLLGSGAVVAACSMERRPEPEYDFNEPLLGKLLARPEWTGDVVVALQFLSPGRHAGPEGEVAQICRRAETGRPGLRTHLTPLVGAHPALSAILADRWRATKREL
ncbi:MAG: cobalamin biosynthesis protein CbiX [Opitutae bacterium]|nr:cobalamin biosynthesis protein CbiX [Opitutae bacterium]